MRCIGLMSGTSLDGVDAVLADWNAAGVLTVAGHVHRPYAAALRAELLALNAAQGIDELHRAELAANAVALSYADAVAALCAESGCTRESIAAVGAHGQTVRHRPGEFDGVGYTRQLLSAALLAERCGIDVVADLRSRDVAAGGQGAPLVPAFHAAMFQRPGHDVAVLNLGGIANLTLLHADGRVGGFDCGPGNVLMDGWCQRHRGQPFDDRGAWAAGGEVDAALLAVWLGDPYFDRPPPKSTGRDLFDRAWLDRHDNVTARKRPQDVQATLAALTAQSVVDALQRHLGAATELLVCGGGAFNLHLMGQLAARLPHATVRSTDSAGLPAMQVEAAAFAWLAREHLARRPGNRVDVTGAAGPRILGALYPAG